MAKPLAHYAHQNQGRPPPGGLTILIKEQDYEHSSYHP